MPPLTGKPSPPTSSVGSASKPNGGRVRAPRSPNWRLCYARTAFLLPRPAIWRKSIGCWQKAAKSLPMVPGRNRTLTHDCKRHGTLDLFAALNAATGEVLHQTRKRHTGKDVLAFFKWIDLHTPAHLDVHIVLDNLSAHKSEPVREWLAHPKRSRWHLHFTPTSASWANLVEGWFSVLARKAIKNNTFNSVEQLADAIDTWTSHWNHDPQPFTWTKPAHDIINKVNRARTALAKSATHH
ncbi:MAG: IS630 family transposase [Acidimicrobiaceae bacterium]|nr:IS630 family transposase [Acidimicrobiaceae bacterium]